MDFKQLVLRNRSYRRFLSEKNISREQLSEWLDSARQTPSARNLQSLKYALSYDADTNAKIFGELKWAGYLPDWNPALSEQPAAYVVFCNDKNLSAVTPQIDLGIQAQTLLLAAVEAGYGGCILLAFNKVNVASILSLPSHLDPVLVVALGVPAEQCVIDPVIDDNIRYYRDSSDIHHVPKRPLSSLII